MTKKSILFITPIYLPASLPGSVVFVRELAERLVKENYKVTVLTTRTDDARFWYKPRLTSNVLKQNEAINGVNVVRLDTLNIYSSFFYILHKFIGKYLKGSKRDLISLMYFGPYFAQLKGFLKENQKFDTIHISTLPMGYNLQVIKILTTLNYNANVVITPFYHKDVEGFSNPLIKTILDKVSTIHVLTKVEQEAIKNIFAVPETKFSVTPLFIDTAKLASQESIDAKAAELVSKYNLKDKKIILFAGNKGNLKGAINVLNAVAELYKSDKTIRLIAIGNSTPEWEFTKKNIDTSFLIDLGYQTGVTKEAIFSLCHVFCMPSLSESFGIVYLEAWHKRKPLITATVDSVLEITSGGALNVGFGNIEELKSALTTLLNDPVLCKKLGEFGYAKLRNEYTLDAVIARYMKIL